MSEERKARPWLRGTVWMAVGALVWIASLIWGRPIVVRGTDLPWGLVVIGVGAVLLGYDLWVNRRRA